MGEFYPEIIIEDKVILEIKAVTAIAPEHQAQILNYLKATGIEIGILANFGSPKLEYWRFDNRYRVTTGQFDRDEEDAGDNG